MLKMKKILSILLMLIFVTSVTAAAASAHEDNFGRHNHNDFKKFDDRGDFGRHHHNDFDMGHWVPGHYETQVIKTVNWFHGEKIVIKKFVNVWVPGHWVPGHHFFR